MLEAGRQATQPSNIDGRTMSVGPLHCVPEKVPESNGLLSLRALQIAISSAKLGYYMISEAITFGRFWNTVLYMLLRAVTHRAR
jgi:hypothetical protein